MEDQNTDIAIDTVRENAFSAWKQLTLAIGIRNKSYAIVGASLKKIRDEELWKHLGNGGYKSWSGFLCTPEIGMSVKTAYNYIFFYEEMVERLGYTLEETEHISYTRLIPYQTQLRELPVDIAKGKVEQISSLTSFDYERHKHELLGHKKKRRWFWFEKGTRKVTVELLTNDTNAIYLDGQLLWKNPEQTNQQNS